MQKYKFKPLHDDFVNFTEKMKTSLNNHKSTFQMKTYVSLLMVAIASITAGYAQQNTKYQDDIYYSSKDAAAEKEGMQRQKQREQTEAAAQKKQEEQNAARNAANTSNDDYYQSPSSRENSSAANSTSSTTASNTSSSFDYDDYYDYEYAARLRRFHNNIPSYGYYDNFYTNSYWYSGNPYNYGTSIYMGYNFWGPSYYTYSYYPRYNWYMTWGWGYDPWYNPFGYYNPWAYNPYWYNPYGYYSCWNPHYHWYSNNYFNSYDRNSYYGPRNSLTASGRRSSDPTMAHRYMNAVEMETQKPFSETKGRTTNPFLTPTRPSSISNNNNNTINLDPGNDVKEPRRGSFGNTTQPSNQSNNNNGITTDPKNQIEVTEPRRGTRNDILTDPGRPSNINNNGGVSPNNDIEIKNTEPSRPRRRDNIQQQPSKQSNGGFEMQQPSRQYEQPSRQEPSRAPQFEQPRNSGSSSPSTNRPRR